MKKVRKIVMGVELLCISAAVIYLVIARYYSKGFSVNTWINGVYCTGKTIEDVNLELLDKTKAPSIYIVVPEDRSFVLTPEDISLKGDYTFVLKEYLSAQNPFLWVFRLGKQTETLLSPEFTYKEEKLTGNSKEVYSYSFFRFKETLSVFPIHEIIHSSV